MIKEEHHYKEYTCYKCGWTGEGIELTEDGECPKCYATLEEDFQK